MGARRGAGALAAMVIRTALPDRGRSGACFTRNGFESAAISVDWAGIQTKSKPAQKNRIRRTLAQARRAFKAEDVKKTLPVAEGLTPR